MSAKLVLSLNGQPATFPLTQENFTIGRQPGNDLVLADPSVSAAHARILTILNDSFLEDNGSTNGVFVNGKKVVRHVLVDGDEVTIGRHKIQYVDDAGKAMEELARTVVVPPGEAPVVAPSQARLILLGKDEEREMLLEKSLTTIGKPGVQVAAISRRKQGDFLVHVDDGAGDQSKVPLVNGEPIGFSSHQLKHDDVIEIAGVSMRYVAG